MTASRDESGIEVYPRLPVPRRRKGETRPPNNGRPDRRLIAVVAASVIAGGAGAWFLRPAIAPDAGIAAASKRASDAEQAASAQKQRAEELSKSLDAAARARRDAEAKLGAAEAAQNQLTGKAADDEAQRKATEAVQARLKAAVDRTTGVVAVDGGEVHVQISERALFKPADDALTDRGRAVLAKLAAALKDLPDKLVRVQGHTDDQPPPPVRAAAPAAKKGARPAAPPIARFPTNWELSAARALAVVHYLQDVAKLDPARLAALAFGQYAPISKKDRSVNRRIEIVVVGRRAPDK
jgi:chemotaxis protein MotB